MGGRERRPGVPRGAGPPRRAYVGRPSPLYETARFAPADRRIVLKREDLNHTGAHKINNALGQILLARRLGKRRIVAETGAGQHGVATATVCARFGLECVVYMGAEDMRRQHPNVERMRLLGAEVSAVEFGTKTLKEATSEAIRDWIANVETTYYLIGSCVGPAPYPSIVRELQAVIGREARAQMLETYDRLPDAVVACVGGGSNAIGLFAGFLGDADVRLVGVEAAGAASLGAGRAGSPPRRALVGARRRGRAGPRRTLDLRRARLPGCRAGACGAARLRPRRVCDRDRRGGTRRVPSARRDARGSCRRSSPPTRSRERSTSTRSSSWSACPGGGTRISPRCSSTEHRRSSSISWRAPETPELARGRREGGADLIEIGFPFSDPLADGPVIRRAAERALAQGMRTAECLECLATIREQVAVPLVPMTYASLLEAYGWERFATNAREAGASVADRGRSARRRAPRAARVQLVAPTSTDERIALAAERTDGWLYLVTVAGTTGARAELSPALAPLVERARALTDVPLYAGFGISTPEQAASGGRARGRRRRRLGRARRRRRGSRSARALRRSAARCARLSDEPVASHVPCVGARVDVLEVAGVREHAELAWVARVPSGGGVARRDPHRNGVVALAVQEELRDAEREPLPRRGEDVPLEVVPRVAEQGPGRRRRRHEAGSEGEIEHAGLRDDGVERDARVHSGRTARQVPRPAAQNASCPPAECPTAPTCARSSGASSSASTSIPAATSRNVSGHPPPAPTRRYSRFHAAVPCAARSMQIPSISDRSYWARQYPPWTTTQAGKGPAPGGRKSSPSWPGSGPYGCVDRVMRPAGFEPAASRSGGARSIP